MRKPVLVLMLVLMCLTQTVFAESIAISLSDTLFAPNEEIIVEVSGITEQMVKDEAYVSIYKEGAAHDDYMSWHRPTAGTSKLKFVAPSEPGYYEMRLYRIDHEYTDESFVTSISFQVALAKQGKISLEKNAYLAEQIIPVTVTDITHEMEKAEAYVSIFKKGAAHDEYGTFKYVRAGNSVVELEAPNLNGEFEMRLYSIDHNYTDESFVMSVPFTLSGAVDYNASEWAKTEIKKADEMGLIPDSLRSADLTKPITRAEFAAVSVKLYEKLSAIKATPSSVNPFKDTNDQEVLKAYEAGITAGTAADTFAPNNLLNREQAATMLTRVFKKSYVEGWTLDNDGKFTFNYTMPPKFKDDANISDWAKPSVYFMVTHGIISGVGDNNFAPKATTSSEQAANYASATREQAIAISVRMTEKLDSENASEITPIAPKPEEPKIEEPKIEEPKNEEPKIEEPKAEEPKTGTGIVGSWEYFAASGSVAFGSSLEFKSDGTFIRVVGTVINYTYDISACEGNYEISGDKLILTNQMMSKGYEKSWEELWKISDSVIKDIPVADQEYTIEIVSDDVLIINGTEFERML